jgi:hypothetical protein
MRKNKLYPGMKVAIGTQREYREGRLTPAIVVATGCKRKNAPQRIELDSYNALVMLKGSGDDFDTPACAISSLAIQDSAARASAFLAMDLILISQGVVLVNIITNMVYMSWSDWIKKRVDWRSTSEVLVDCFQKLGVSSEFNKESEMYRVDLSQFQAEALIRCLKQLKEKD